VEEAIVALLAAVAGVMLFLGLAQALDDRPLRRIPRRQRPETRLERRIAAAAPALDPATPFSSSSEIERPPALATEPTTATNESLELEMPAGNIGDGRAPVHATDGSRECVQRAPLVGAMDARDLALVESCAALCLADRAEQALAELAARPLAGGPPAASAPALVATALWSLAGLAHATSDDRPAAQASFDRALQSSPGSVHDPCPPGVAELAAAVAGRFLDMGERAAADGDDGVAPERAAASQLAAFWLRWRLAGVPGDGDAAALLERARAMLADARAEAATALIRQGRFADARGFIGRAMETGDLPVARGEIMLDAWSAAVRQEVDHLTDAALRGDGDDDQAVAGLLRARAVLASMPDGALPPTQRTIITRRIWRSQAKLGFRRLRLGQFDAAADVLSQAFTMTEVAPRQQRQVRDALVRALESMAAERADFVSVLLGKGKREAAAEEVARVEQWIDRVRQEGVPLEEPEVAQIRARRLARALEQA